MKFTDSHEWIKQEGESALVGVSAYAQKELGDIVYVELPRIGKEVNKGEEAAVLESTKAAADVYAPLSGTILEVNEVLKEKPELINQSPEVQGWIFKIKLSKPSEIDALMDQSTYQKMVQK